MVFKVSWLSVLLLFLSISSLQAAPPSALSLSIESSTSTILRYEPLPLRLILRNTSGKTVETILGLDRLGIETTLYVAYEDEKYAEWKRGWLPDLQAIGLPKRKLQPGQAASHALEILWQASFPVFAKTGIYKIKARWQGSNITLESLPYQVTVIDGSEREQEALEHLLAAKLEGYLALDAIDFLPESAQERHAVLERLYLVAQDFNDSRYGVRALNTLLAATFNDTGATTLALKTRALAENQIKRRPHPDTLYFYARLKSATDPQLAIKYLQNAQSRQPDILMAEKIQSAVAQLKRKQQ